MFVSCALPARHEHGGDVVHIAVTPGDCDGNVYWTGGRKRMSRSDLYAGDSAFSYEDLSYKFTRKYRAHETCSAFFTKLSLFTRNLHSVTKN